MSKGDAVRQGMAAAAKKGVKIGRPPKYGDEIISQVVLLREAGISWNDIATQMGIPKGTARRAYERGVRKGFHKLELPDLPGNPKGAQRFTVDDIREMFRRNPELRKQAFDFLGDEILTGKTLEPIPDAAYAPLIAARPELSKCDGPEQARNALLYHIMCREIRDYEPPVEE